MNVTATIGGLLHKPITGGVFGIGRYALASIPRVTRGLHAIQYMVVEPQAGAVLSIADDKVEALADARRVLTGSADSQSRQLEPEQLLLELGFHDSQVSTSPRAEPVAVGRVSRRRQEIFAKSRGCCHYCGAALSLDGDWHVEHMMPKALGGSDGAVNLVAACAPCNLAKSDRTAIEFVTRPSSVMR